MYLTKKEIFHLLGPSRYKIQIEKHSKIPMKNYVKNYNVPDDYVTYEVRHDYQDQSKMLPYLYVFPTKEE
jgi:hypothetical protein